MKSDSQVRETRRDRTYVFNTLFQDGNICFWGERQGSYRSMGKHQLQSEVTTQVERMRRIRYEIADTEQT